MIAVLALASCLLSQSKLEFKQVWKVGQTFKVGDVVIGYRQFSKGPNDHTVRWLSGQVQLQPGSSDIVECLCELDVNDGSTKVVSTFPERRLELDDQSGVLFGANIVDPVTLQPLFALPREGNSGEIRGDGLAKAILPSGLYKVAEIGEFFPAWDSPEARILIVDNEVRRFKPGTWEPVDTLLSQKDLMQGPAYEARVPQVIGNPGSGPFVLRYQSPMHDFYFTEDGTRIDMRIPCQCTDAGPKGLLFTYFASDTPIQCLDPKTGAVKWTARNCGTGPKWVGDYVVASLRVTADGEPANDMFVLDGETGEVLLKAPIRSLPGMPDKIVGDVLIYMDGDGGYSGYKIVKT